MKRTALRALIPTSVALTITLVQAPISWTQGVTEPHRPERCSERVKFNKPGDFEWLAVRSKVDNIIGELKYSPKQFEMMSFEETEDLGAHAYLLGFLISSKGDKAAQDAKATLSKSVPEAVKKAEPEIDKLSFAQQITLKTWESKSISLVLKSFDQGSHDGANPCPERPKGEQHQ